MITATHRLAQGAGWLRPPAMPGEHQLVLAFGARSLLEADDVYQTLRGWYPRAVVVCCSTAGEIDGDRVFDDTVVATAILLEHGSVVAASVDVADADDSHDAGRRLGARLPRDGLRHVLVLSDGLHVNGSALARGLADGLPKGTVVTGGLAGDGSRFERTVVGLDGRARPRLVVAVGLYGERLVFGCGSVGGWDPFGPERLITRSCGNVLYELDGRPALCLYRQYLGDHADRLPSSGLLFPLSLRLSDDRTGVVRTLLSVDEAAGSITFAGDVPTGAYARLMRANFDRLIDGATSAAERTLPQGAAPGLALLISCVGRKLVLEQRIEEEVEGVRAVLGRDVAICGFYSYGEISPFTRGSTCELHNQTMTVTTVSEA